MLLTIQSITLETILSITLVTIQKHLQVNMQLTGPSIILDIMQVHILVHTQDIIITPLLVNLQDIIIELILGNMQRTS